ncbi:MAG: hypothetical protein HDR14_05020 [Lachnospiraceae bacterium]|nr:hypothetical protein [Lachnospiraceae bacterium]
MSGMMSLEDGCRIAAAYFAEREIRGIRQILTAEKVWIFLPGEKGVVEFGGNGVTVDRQTGEARPFILPSKEGFRLLQEAREEAIPEEYLYNEESTATR